MRLAVITASAILSLPVCALGQGNPGKLRVFGRAPKWADESWFLRRQLDRPWALRGGHVVDVRTGEIRRNTTIIITADVIRSVGDDKVPDGAETIDIGGQYVIPGLFDLHAHVMPQSLFFPTAKDPEETLRILLEAGVTTIRLLPLHSESALAWSARINAGHLAGPTIVPASVIFEKEAQRTSRGFGDAETARAWVQREALLGSRWIKVYNKMDETCLRMIIETARLYGMKVCGHTEDVPPHRASELGIASVEHITSIPLSCLRENAQRDFRLHMDLAARTAGRWAEVDDEKLAALAQAFRGNHTAWVPTLVVSERTLRQGHDGGPAPDDPTRKALEQAIQKAARAAVQLHRDGGLVGLGTDFPIDGVTPGESVHRELELFVESGGATPLEALQIGTLASARILGFESILGSVEPGKIANLVVVRENPLERISNTRGITLVAHDGRICRPP